MNKAVNMKGIAIPIEYTNNRNTPLNTVSVPEAITSIEPSTGPKHGVQPDANAIPISIELNQLLILLGLETLLSISKSLNFKIPIIFNPNIMIKMPLILEKRYLFLTKNLPIRLADVPIIMNITVNPITNPIVLLSALILLS